MNRVWLSTAWAGLGLLAACATSDRRPPEVPVRLVAFDNVYGKVDRLTVQVKVDDGIEQSLVASCDAATCTFMVPLSRARHELTMSVEQNGQRSAPTKVVLDAGAPR